MLYVQRVGTHGCSTLPPSLPPPHSHPAAPSASPPQPCPLQDVSLGSLALPVKDVARNGNLKDIWTLQVLEVAGVAPVCGSGGCTRGVRRPYATC